MSKIRAALLVGVALCVAAHGALAAPAPAPQTPAAKCVASVSHARVDWSPGSNRAVNARVYFRAPNAKAEHYLEMKKAANGRYWAMLPKAAANTPYVDYRVATLDAKGLATTRHQGRLAVTKDCASTPLRADEAKAATTLVVGAEAEAPPIPVGFRCDGIIAQITPAGELKAYNACREEALVMASVQRREQQQVNQPNEQAPSAAAGKGADEVTEVAEGDVTGSGVGVIGPTHHRRPHRTPAPPRTPQPRLREPVSPSRP